MPELPEVETVRRDLEKVLVGKKITAVEVLDKKIVGNKPAVFVLATKGKKIVGVERRGKLLAFKLSSITLWSFTQFSPDENGWVGELCSYNIASQTRPRCLDQK